MSAIREAAELIESIEPAKRYKPYPAYKNSGIEWLGEVPEGWEAKRLKCVVRLRNEKVEPESDMGYIGLENIE